MVGVCSHGKSGLAGNMIGKERGGGEEGERPLLERERGAVRALGV